MMKKLVYFKLLILCLSALTLLTCSSGGGGGGGNAGPGPGGGGNPVGGGGNPIVNPNLGTPSGGVLIFSSTDATSTSNFLSTVSFDTTGKLGSVTPTSALDTGTDSAYLWSGYDKNIGVIFGMTTLGNGTPALVSYSFNASTGIGSLNSSVDFPSTKLSMALTDTANQWIMVSDLITGNISVYPYDKMGHISSAPAQNWSLISPGTVWWPDLRNHLIYSVLDSQITSSANDQIVGIQAINQDGSLKTSTSFSQPVPMASTTPSSIASTNSFFPIGRDPAQGLLFSLDHDNNHLQIFKTDTSTEVISNSVPIYDQPVGTPIPGVTNLAVIIPLSTNNDFNGIDLAYQMFFLIDLNANTIMPFSYSYSNGNITVNSLTVVSFTALPSTFAGTEVMSPKDHLLFQVVPSAGNATKIDVYAWSYTTAGVQNTPIVSTVDLGTDNTTAVIGAVVN
jgi:hypothetical protein